MSKRLLTTLALLAAAAAVAAVTIGLTAVKRPSASGPMTSTVDSASKKSAGPAQVSDGGGVQVKVSFDPATSITGDRISFTVAMDTHSVELGQFDLSKLSRITMDPGGQLTDLSWQPRGEGGHHLEGILSAKAQTGALKGARSIKLEIAGVASQDSRRFEWKVGAP